MDKHNPQNETDPNAANNADRDERLRQRAENPTTDINAHKLHVTFFSDVYAKTLTTKSLTLPELRDLILAARAPIKDDLPWLKGAKFGKIRTDPPAKCLRHDANVIYFYFIELDYDGEHMSFDAAAVILREMNVRCLIYTSPNHTDAAPRWRVLMPVSCKLALDMRAKLCARVNGKFKGIFDAASFKLSQSYYYGMALDNPAPNHRAEIIDGRMIDLCNDLYKFEKDGWPQGDPAADNAYTNTDGEDYQNQGRGFEVILAELGDAPGLKGFHRVLISATSSYAATHPDDFDRKVLKDILLEAINAAPKNKTAVRAKNIQRYISDAYLDDLIKTAIRKFGQNAQEQKAFKQEQQTAYGQSGITRPKLRSHQLMRHGCR
jgi:hypothetical protein